MNDFKNQVGIIHLILLLGILFISAVVTVILFVKRPSDGSLSKAPDREKVTVQVAAENQADKAFGEKKDYSNPFKEDKNPFDYLNE